MSSSGPVSATNKDATKKQQKVKDFYSSILNKRNKNKETGQSAASE